MHWFGTWIVIVVSLNGRHAAGSHNSTVPSNMAVTEIMATPDGATDSLDHQFTLTGSPPSKKGKEDNKSSNEPP